MSRFTLYGEVSEFCENNEHRECLAEPVGTQLFCACVCHYVVDVITAVHRRALAHEQGGAER